MQFSVNSIRICIDEMNDQENRLAGSICGITMPDRISFANGVTLILAIDRILDQIGQPQATRHMRSFHPEEERDRKSGEYCGAPVRYHRDEEIAAQCGKVMTLDVVIESRQHNSWQGVVHDVAGNIAYPFVSELEFTRILFEQSRKHLETESLRQNK